MTSSPTREAMDVARALNRDSNGRGCYFSNRVEHRLALALDAFRSSAPPASAVESAARAFVVKLDEVTPHINAAFVFGAVHGQKYDGPTYGAELDALRRALSTAPPRESPPPSRTPTEATLERAVIEAAKYEHRLRYCGEPDQNRIALAEAEQATEDAVIALLAASPDASRGEAKEG